MGNSFRPFGAPSRAVETALRSGNGTLHVPFPSSKAVKATPWLCQESAFSPSEREAREKRLLTPYTGRAMGRALAHPLHREGYEKSACSAPEEEAKMWGTPSAPSGHLLKYRVPKKI